MEYTVNSPLKLGGKIREIGSTVEVSEKQLSQNQADELVALGRITPIEEPAPKRERPTVPDTVKLVEAVTSLEELEPFAADDRKGVQDAVEKRRAELTANQE